MNRTVAVSVVAALLLAALPAPAQPAKVRSPGERLFDEGEKAFQRGDYDQAIAKFEAAYPLYPEPLILFNIASAYRKQHACADARTYYHRYLLTNPAADFRKKAEDRLAEMEACATPAASLEPPVPADGPARDRVVPTPPDGAGPGPDPVGPTVVAPTAAGPDAGTITIAPSENRTDPDGRQAHAGRGKRIAGLVTAGVGVGLIGTGGYFSAQARDAASDVEDACTNGCVAADVAGRDADGKTAQRNATIFYAAGGAAIAIGATLAIWGWRDGRTAADHVTLVPSRTGAIAVAGWSF